MADVSITKYTSLKRLSGEASTPSLPPSLEDPVSPVNPPGSGTQFGVGILLNGNVIGGVKRVIESSDTLEIPELWDYNTFTLDIDGVVFNDGQINFIAGSSTTDTGVTSVTSVTTDGYLILELDQLIVYESATPIETTLPDATSQAGKTFKIKNIGAGALKVLTTSSQTIDNELIQVLGTNDGMVVQSTGSNYIII